MHPILLIVIALGLGKLLVEAFKEDPELEEIDHNKIFQDYMIDLDEEDLDFDIIKQRTTKAINRLIRECEGFKIGKSGNPKNRKSNHAKYSRMFILCKSSDQDLIDELEAHYNSKYINDPKNDNQKEGSAGESIAYGNDYYLYVVLR